MPLSVCKNHSFASDTVAPICPEAWKAIELANSLPYASSYSEDEISGEAASLIQSLFGKPCQVFFTTSGTAANALALSFLADPTESIISLADAHIQIDEANAPEFYTSGAKLVGAKGQNGKLDPRALAPLLHSNHGYHAAAAKVISLTQATDYGTVYLKSELQEFQKIKEQNPGLKIHMDGARFANAVAALGVPAKDSIPGVDILTFGSTKNGCGLSEAIVCFDQELFDDSKKVEKLKRKLKRGGQLTAKARYLSAGWIGTLKEDVWLKNAAHANAMAQKVAEGLKGLGLELAVPVETNQVFVKLTEKQASELTAQGWQFYYFSNIGAYRFVCSWCTKDEDVGELLADIRKIR